jgi:hypothetical protein
MVRFSGDGPGRPRFDRCLTWALALMTLIRKLGRHNSNTSLATEFDATKRASHRKII